MRSTTQSPMSPPPAKRMKASVEKCNKGGGGLSVLEMFNRRVAKEHSKKVSALIQGLSLVAKTFSTN